MPNDREDDLRDLWQDQSLDGFGMSAEDMRQKASQFENEILWRNLIEYVGAGIVAVIFGRVAIFGANTIGRLGAALIVMAVLYYAYQRHAQGAAQSVLPDADLQSYIQFHRASLERQRDFLNRGVRIVFCLVPGAVLLGILSVVRNGTLLSPTRTEAQTHSAIIVVGNTVLSCGILVALGAMNKRAARKLQEQIDVLDRTAG